MANKQTEESYGSDEAPTPLQTFADVRRAIARTLRRLEKGSIDRGDGQVLINGYGTLANLIREDVSDDIIERLERIEARVPAAASPH